MLKFFKAFISFIISGIMVIFTFGILCRYFFMLVWNFDIINSSFYIYLYNYWNNGGVLNTFYDCSLCFCLFLLPCVWFLLSKKLYKYGLVNLLSFLFIKIYRYLTNPGEVDTNVVLKNFGGKERELDEIITERLQAEGNNIFEKKVSKQIREQIFEKK